jgi:hypothetical protein
MAGLSLALLVVPKGLMLADGGSRLEKSIQCTSTPRVTITNPTGGVVVVRGWDRSEVHAICNAASSKVAVDWDQMPASGDAEKVRFATHLLDSQAGPQEKTVNYEIDIPNGASLEIFNPSGSVTVQGVSGDDWVESVSGPVIVTDGAGHTSVTSLNGNIQLIRPTGRVEVNSITGDLRFVASVSNNVRAETTSGNIYFDGDFEPLGSYSLVSYQGNLDVSCPSTDSLELLARTAKGKIDNELHLRHPERRSYAPPGSSAFGTIDTGKATVNLRSYSGTIHIHPRQ